MIITPAEFKAQFPRFTPEYLPVYTQGTYFKDNIKYYEGLFYKVIVDSTTSIPTNTDDWELYNDSVLNYTQDEDIMNAVLEANVNFNENICYKNRKYSFFVQLFHRIYQYIHMGIYN